MKDYKVRFLPLFEEDLNAIVDYISLQLENPKAAYSLVDEVRVTIQKRLPFAENYEPFPSRVERSFAYYRIYVNHYIIFYIVDGDIMEVRRILYGKRDWEKHL